LKYHPIENPNQGRSVAKLFDETPQSLAFIPILLHQLLQLTKHFKASRAISDAQVDISFRYQNFCFGVKYKLIFW
jgi:hypothetical protein